jgi:hypothetical protein
VATELGRKPDATAWAAKRLGISLQAKRRESPLWTPDEDARLRRLAEEGRSAAVIAERLKRAKKAIQSRCAKLDISLKRLPGGKSAAE